jgi:crotonobetainyl-CoA:carnitine CoA-transferase CaiB-like acyl-CoA transferase
MAGPAHDATGGDPGPSERGALHGLRVLDVSTLFAGPLTATFLADHGADVVKVEHPRGDGLRGMGWRVHGTSLMWTVVNRNKRCVTLDLHTARGQELFRCLAATVDVVVENFRPGTLERWGLGFEDLRRDNPGLIMLQVTAFGQTGPWRDRPGFGTIAEAISGFAFINGYPDGPPTLPPFALGDAIAGIFGVAAVLSAVYRRDASPDRRGQAIDLSIFEPLFWLLGPQISVFDQLGEIQQRSGNHTAFTAPRNLYRAGDGGWLAVSGSATSVAERLMRMVGRPNLIDEPWFGDASGRLAHQSELDGPIETWIAARSSEEVMTAADRFEVAVGPIYSIEDIAQDEHYRARGSIVRAPDGEGRDETIAVQNVVPVFSDTPGAHRWMGRALGADDDAILGEELGLGPDELEALRSTGVIARPAAPSED